MDENLPAVLHKVEHLLKDKCTHYLVVVMDGEDVFTLTDSKVVAMGLARRVVKKIDTKWEQEENNDEE